MSAKTEGFFSPRNEAMLQRVLYNDVCRRVGGDLNEKQATRLLKTVKHYMGEVNRVQGHLPMTAMNAEVLQIVLPDYMMYMERSVRGSGRSVISDIEVGPGPLPGSSALQVQQGPMQAIENNDVDTAFSKMQAARQQAKPTPMPQDFRVSLRDEGPVPIDIFERIKQDREEEARRATVQQSQAQAQKGQQAVAQQGQQGYAAATGAFAQDRRRADAEAEAAFAERERKRLEVRATASGTMPEPPDMRALILGNGQVLERTLNRPQQNEAAGNPTVFNDFKDLPQRDSALQMITKEPEIMAYKENELNLFVYSGDRDWINASGNAATTESRYNFSVNFDPSNMPTGLRLSPTSTVKFRNIVRIELVKAIMPGESVDTLTKRSYSGSSFTYTSPYNINILSFPYIQVRIPELDNNIYGTNQGLNSAFGVLQYDANWVYDTANGSARGFFAMIPKFLKCQKVYQPTPLATIQKLTFRFERPDGTLVSTIPDTLDISRIYSSKMVAATTAFPYGYDTGVEANTSAAYYFIKSSTYFNKLTVSEGNRIVVKNLTWATTATSVAQQQDFLTYIQQDAGLFVVDVAHGTSMSDIVLGANIQGYCNFIIVRGKFTDPTAGSTLATVLGKLADTSTPVSIQSGSITEFLNAQVCVTGRLLNQSNQVQVAMRVITRELDATGVLRPDNL